MVVVADVVVAIVAVLVVIVVEVVVWAVVVGVVAIVVSVVGVVDVVVVVVVVVVCVGLSRLRGCGSSISFRISGTAFRAAGLHMRGMVVPSCVGSAASSCACA